MNRDELLRRLEERPEPWDLVVIGGGATGVGVALDGASRGYDVLLLEQSDFGKATSTRSTKLVHGGVRYLQQGNIPLVMEALRERGILRRNAPHLVHDLPFVVPNYRWWEAPFYGVGMRVYDVLAGKYGFGSSRTLSEEETVERLPTIEREGLRGGVVYHDGQFDDARLLVHMVLTALEQGATLLNYVEVTGLIGDGAGFVSGVRAVDRESGAEHEVPARGVINATGIFTDRIRSMDDEEAAPILRPSQGVHLVLDRSFLPGDSAIMVPRTDDGRVLFAIPWNDRVLIGTTETPVEGPELEPCPRKEEVEFLLEHAGRYLSRDPTREDVKSVFAGIRPLVAEEGASETSQISREHQIRISDSGLVTIAGGKWTTYRKMAEETVDHAATIAGLELRESGTRSLNIHGYHRHAEDFGALAHYGSDAPEVEALLESAPGWDERLHPRLPARRGEVIWAARREMARTVDDVLARRTRSLILDARAAREAAPRVAELLAGELGRDVAWETGQVETFTRIAEGYILNRA